ncbi:MAG: glycosyltransferase, partial [Candidatus Omnitrophica bacterium]|nr:glycosyltransferase [Candidatus Omnitrophota bacterium]
PKVTVLMPVYNGERFLREAVKSILNQTYTDYELLIIDDASRDSSAEIINSFSDRRIRFVKNKKNMGQMNTMNKGLGLVSGEYIARMDQDDISLPGRLEKEVKVLDANPEIPLVFSDTYIIDSKGKRRKKTVLDRVKAGEKCDFNGFLRGDFHICQCTTLIRRSIFDKVGLYNPAYKITAEHELYHFRILFDHEIKFIKEPLTEYRLYGGNTTSDVERTSNEIMDAMVKFTKKAIPGYQQKLLKNAISMQLATLALCKLFARKRKTSIATALRAMRLNIRNIKACAVLACAFLLPDSAIRKIENRRRRLLGEDV